MLESQSLTGMRNFTLSHYIYIYRTGEATLVGLKFPVVRARESEKEKHTGKRNLSYG